MRGACTIPLCHGSRKVWSMESSHCTNKSLVSAYGHDYVTEAESRFCGLTRFLWKEWGKKIPMQPPPHPKQLTGKMHRFIGFSSHQMQVNSINGKPFQISTVFPRKSCGTKLPAAASKSSRRNKDWLCLFLLLKMQTLAMPSLSPYLFRSA